MNTTDNRLLHHVGAKLKALRQQQGLSLEEAKAATGVALTEIENGKKDMPIDVLATICELYQTNLSEFLRDIENLIDP